MLCIHNFITLKHLVKSGNILYWQCMLYVIPLPTILYCAMLSIACQYKMFFQGMLVDDSQYDTFTNINI